MSAKELETGTKIYTYRDVYCRVTWKQLKHPTIVEWLNKLEYSNVVKHRAMIKTILSENFKRHGKVLLRLFQRKKLDRKVYVHYNPVM